jgi:NADP-dependent 3-hydroxy acid dehydrogenase YdfG
MTQNTSSVFLVTGCSSGLGRELAIGERSPIFISRISQISTDALARGFRVIATARKVETLTGLEEKGAKVLPLDVTSTPKALKEFAAKAIAI